MGSSPGEPPKSGEGPAGQHPPHHLRHCGDHLFEDLKCDLAGNDETSCRSPPTLMTTFGVASLYLLINVWGFKWVVWKKCTDSGLADTWILYMRL